MQRFLPLQEFSFKGYKCMLLNTTDAMLLCKRLTVCYFFASISGTPQSGYVGIYLVGRGGKIFCGLLDKNKSDH